MTTTKSTTKPAQPKSDPRAERVQHPDLPTALAAFQAELPQVGKSNQAQVPTKNGGQYSYQYADLSDVTGTVLPLLARHGLSFSAFPTDSEHGFVLAYKLLHESGQELSGIYPLPPASTPPQQLGSAITYARRYVLCAVTGVAPGGDDDDAAAAQHLPSAPPRAPQPEAAARPSVAGAAEQWLGAIRGATSPDDLTAIYQQANSRGQAGPEVMQALTDRKHELRQDAHAPEQPAA